LRNLLRIWSTRQKTGGRMINQKDRDTIKNVVEIAVLFDKNEMSMAKHEVAMSGSKWTKEHELYVGECHRATMNIVNNR
jgi:hypothetical protein